MPATVCSTLARRLLPPSRTMPAIPSPTYDASNRYLGMTPSPFLADRCRASALPARAG